MSRSVIAVTSARVALRCADDQSVVLREHERDVAFDEDRIARIFETEIVYSGSTDRASVDFPTWRAPRTATAGN